MCERFRPALARAPLYAITCTIIFVVCLGLSSWYLSTIVQFRARVIHTNCTVLSTTLHRTITSHGAMECIAFQMLGQICGGNVTGTVCLRELVPENELSTRWPPGSQRDCRLDPQECQLATLDSSTELILPSLMVVGFSIGLLLAGIIASVILSRSRSYQALN